MIVAGFSFGLGVIVGALVASIFLGPEPEVPPPPSNDYQEW